MFHKKNAFTLIEVVIVFSIIGIILALELTSLKGRINQYSQPYYTAYNTLFKAAYNVQADMFCPDPSSKDPDCKNGPRPFPTTTVELCNRLKEFINTSPGQGSCENTDINDESDNANQFNEKHLRFVASNSFRYYIAKRKFGKSNNFKCSTGGTKQPCAGYNPTDNLDYFVVYVDINGTSNPNRVGMGEVDEIYPDIVPFAITRRGEVVPMGYPIFSKIYMTAKIKYPQVEEIDPETKEIKGFFERKLSNSMTYFEAVIGAYGGSANIENPDSILFTEKMNKNFPGRSFYVKDKKITTFKEDGVIIKDGSEYSIHFDTGSSDPNIRRCAAGTFDCEVIIDSTVNKRF